MIRVTHAVVAVAMLVAMGCQPPAPAELSQEDIAAIQAVSDRFVQGILSGDMTAMAALYTADGMVLPPNAPLAQGHAAITETFASFPPVTTFSLDNLEIVGQGDIAYVVGRYTLTMQPEGGDPIQDEGKYMEIRVRGADNSWLLHRDIFNSSLPLPEMPMP